MKPFETVSLLSAVIISSIHKGFDFMNTRFFILIWFYVESRFSPAPFFEADDVFCIQRESVCGKNVNSR